MNDPKRTKRLDELIKAMDQLSDDQWSSAMDYLVDCARTKSPVIKSKKIGLSWIGCGANIFPKGTTTAQIEQEIKELWGGKYL